MVADQEWTKAPSQHEPRCIVCQGGRFACVCGQELFGNRSKGAKLPRADQVEERRTMGEEERLQAPEKMFVTIEPNIGWDDGKPNGYVFFRCSPHRLEPEAPDEEHEYVLGTKHRRTQEMLSQAHREDGDERTEPRSGAASKGV